MNFENLATLEIDWKALGYVCGLFALVYIYLNTRSVQHYPRVFFSTLEPLKALPKNLKSRCASLPNYLAYAALLLFCIAIIDPRLFLSRPVPPTSLSEATEGIAIYLVLDQSGSMNETVPGTKDRKIELLKKITAQFIDGRRGDLIGLIAFARVPLVLSPLTQDHHSLLNQLKTIQVVPDKAHDGTAIGYALYKTANLMAATRRFAETAPKGKQPYDIKSSIMILVTDGVQEIHPLDKDNTLRSMDIPEAAHFAKQQNVRLYIVNIDPSIMGEEFSPFRIQIQKSAELTGGKFFMMSSPDQLGSIYAEINILEKSRLKTPQVNQFLSKDNLPHLYQRVPLYPYFILAGLIALVVSIFLNSTLLKQFP